MLTLHTQGLPLPSKNLLDTNPPVFEPSGDLEDWVRETFISGKGEMVNDDHSHLAGASLGFVWTNVDFVKAGKRIVGTAQLGLPAGQAWSRGRQEVQLLEWFGEVPDFLITLDATYVSTANWPSICALIEHELYHCGQKVDRWGSPVYDKKTGAAVWDMKPHDVEEFVGVVRRYGAEATGTSELVAAANAKPLFGKATVDGICGSCSRNI